jgi:hypothetical protein
MQTINRFTVAALALAVLVTPGLVHAHAPAAMLLVAGAARAHATVPEMDPGLASAGFTLLAGSLLMVFGRR